MTHKRYQRVLIDGNFGPGDFANQAFAPDRTDPAYAGLRAFRDFFAQRGVQMDTVDAVESANGQYDYVIYSDYSWRQAQHDRFIARIPRDKRVLMLLEPPNVNPSMYFVPWWRNRFAKVFTWSGRLLARHPGYVCINVPAGVDLNCYREAPSTALPFDQRKMLVAIHRNRWGYMPQSAFALRARLFAFFDSHCPEEFDLYGGGWNAPAVFYQKWFGFHHFQTYRGGFPYTFEAKIPVMGKYRFALCIENNPNEPGYISEKMLDCLCARCVPVYYGTPDVRERIPEDCFIDFRKFRSLDELLRFLRAMDADRHRAYIEAADRFLQSEQAQFFTNEHLRQTVYAALYAEDFP
ncbi:MAG: glycosyltransferase family 10 [Magnetococcus sp. WYHC-3]